MSCCQEPGPTALVLADSQEACTSITSTAQKLFQRSGWRRFGDVSTTWLPAFRSCSWIEIAIDCHCHSNTGRIRAHIHFRFGRQNDVIAKSYYTTVSQMVCRMSRSPTWLLEKFCIAHSRDMMIWVLKMLIPQSRRFLTYTYNAERSYMRH